MKNRINTVEKETKVKVNESTEAGNFTVSANKHHPHGCWKCIRLQTTDMYNLCISNFLKYKYMNVSAGVEWSSM